MVNPLHNVSQAIHQDHFNPPTKFFLHSRVVKDEEDSETWEIRLYADVEGKMEVWSSSLDSQKLPATDRFLQEAIQGGMLHVNLRGRSALQKTSKLELQFLHPENEPITIHLDPSHQPDSDGMTLLEAAFTLVSRKVATGAQPDKDNVAEMRGLRKKITEKDEELSRLQTQIANLRAVADNARSSEIKKKLQASPKKPAGASSLQPNAKRRKAVVDEFAGSDSE